MQTINRKQTRQIKLGQILIGGGAPVSIQSMLSVPTRDVQAALSAGSLIGRELAP